MHRADPRRLTGVVENCALYMVTDGAPQPGWRQRIGPPAGRATEWAGPGQARAAGRTGTRVIISASYKTDIPAFYGEWFLGRLRAGHCRMTNPWGGQVYRVALDRDAVEGFVFWTRNAAPFMAGLAEVRRLGYPFVLQVTLTGYPRALERSAPEPERVVEQMRRLAGEYGPRAVVWRYDPILVSTLTPPDFHLANFARLSRALEGASDEVVVSFAHIYRKTRRNLSDAARRHGFAWADPDDDAKRSLVARLAEAAGAAGMNLTVCAQAAYTAPPARPARCIDAARLSDVAARPIRAAVRGNRPDCLCHASRDIGAYDTCPLGCVYCYAVQSHRAARRGHRHHDPSDDMLRPPAAISRRN